VRDAVRSDVDALEALPSSWRVSATSDDDERDLPPSADVCAGIPNVAAQPAMRWIGIQPRVPEQ
jgi:hypothetical protein